MTNALFIDTFLAADEPIQLEMAKSLNQEHPIQVFSLLLERNVDSPERWAQTDADFITRDNPDYPTILLKLKSWFTPDAD
jgi:alpha-D-ribose 1-methylphosphonate 5-triphosphate synthase subunit PhnI